MTKLAPLTDAERAEKRAADREYTKQAIEALRTSDGWRRWLTTRASFHRYSLANQLLIAMQRLTSHCLLGEDGLIIGSSSGRDPRGAWVFWLLRAGRCAGRRVVGPLVAGVLGRLRDRTWSRPQGLTV